MSYTELVKEAFIDPIRSVLIVDDEYPTWDAFLNGQDITKETWFKNRNAVQKMVADFRANSPSLIVDIHNGGPMDATGTEELANHLHQSDLLVLDYHLEGSGGGGTKSVGIARKLLENSHFNLIVLHTSITDLSEPFEEMVLGLLYSPKDFAPKLIENGIKYYSSLDDEEKERFDDVIRPLIGVQQYLNCYKLGVETKPGLKALSQGTGSFSEFNAKCKQEDIPEKEMMNIGVMLLDALQKDLENEKFSNIPHTALNWSDSRSSGGEYWIRTNRGFIAFANKSKTSDLVAALQKALEAWEPTPSRLMSAKLRSELNTQGIIAEDELLEDRLIFRKFYMNLLGLNEEKSGYKKTNALEGQARRHIEGLLDRTIDPVIEFGKKILNYDDIQSNSDSKFLSHYGSFRQDQIDKAFEHYNSYVSSKPPQGWHLTPGHVFCIEEEYWICVSPACDLVPGQRMIGLQTNDGSVKSFIGVRLESGYSSNDLTDRLINSNEFVFIHDGSRIDIRSIYPKNSEPGAKEPHWRIFFAMDEGKFKPNQSTKNLEIKWLNANTGELSFQQACVTVKWQLRYEYALNLNQKLGGNLTRIGLDYLGK